MTKFYSVFLLFFCFFFAGLSPSFGTFIKKDLSANSLNLTKNKNFITAYNQVRSVSLTYSARRADAGQIFGFLLETGVGLDPNGNLVDAYGNFTFDNPNFNAIIYDRTIKTVVEVIPISGTTFSSEGPYSGNNYNVMLTPQPVQVGDPVPNAASVPDGYGIIGEGESDAPPMDGSSPGPATDGTPNGIVELMDITDGGKYVSFGLDSIPQTTNQSYQRNESPSLGDELIITQDGQGLFPIQPEDYDQPYTDGVPLFNLKFTDISGMKGNVLKYNGVPVTTGSTIYGYNYNDILLTVLCSGVNSTGFSFKYMATDSAGFTSNVANYTATWEAPLPVTLIDFTADVIAAKEGYRPQLNWQTAKEENFDRYEIQRSTDGITFNFVDKVAPKGSNSNYSYIDFNAPTGKDYYRLKMVDKDNTFSYSKVVSVNLSDVAPLKVYPTITTSQITVDGLKSESNILVYTISGQLVKRIQTQNQKETIDISSSSAGVYIIQVIHGNDKQSFKIIKQN